MNEKEETQENKEVKSLQLIDYCNYISKTDTETQLRALSFLIVELDLTNITEAMEKVGVNSYNGVQYKCPITTVGKTKFAVLKDI
jgi:hypothetical protein